MDGGALGFSGPPQGALVWKIFSWDQIGHTVTVRPSPNHGANFCGARGKNGEEPYSVHCGNQRVLSSPLVFARCIASGGRKSRLRRADRHADRPLPGVSYCRPALNCGFATRHCTAILRLLVRGYLGCEISTYLPRPHREYEHVLAYLLWPPRRVAQLYCLCCPPSLQYVAFRFLLHVSVASHPISRRVAVLVPPTTAALLSPGDPTASGISKSESAKLAP